MFISPQRLPDVDFGLRTLHISKPPKLLFLLNPQFHKGRVWHLPYSSEILSNSNSITPKNALVIIRQRF